MTTQYIAPIKCTPNGADPYVIFPDVYGKTSKNKCDAVRFLSKADAISAQNLNVNRINENISKMGCQNIKVESLPIITEEAL
jgi:hypothetical protein